jgi:hypothetical protein
MSESLRRAIRTLLQAGTAEMIVLVLEAFVLDFTPEQHGALLLALTTLCTFGQNALEDAEVIPTLLKKDYHAPGV